MALLDEGSITITHMSTDIQEPLGNNLELTGLCVFRQPGVGGRHQVLVKMLNGHVDPNPGCQHYQLLF